MDTRPRVYGSDADDSDPYARPGRTYVALEGGPLDGLLADATGWSAAEVAEGAALIAEHGGYGAGGRALYGPATADPPTCGRGKATPLTGDQKFRIS
ncbi:hypothetical protein ACQEVS_33045 [Streptomyces sp. CA-181903]|uniref:hypothetical protein n=1 Tax=Streptomyces sp. CA-181903 TaxID=3240055 RepID=UPI003D933A47